MKLCLKQYPDENVYAGYAHMVPLCWLCSHSLFFDDLIFFFFCIFFCQLGELMRYREDTEVHALPRTIVRDDDSRELANVCHFLYLTVILNSCILFLIDLMSR